MGRARDHRAVRGAQVWNSPDAIALVFGETALSYAALNARANRLARRLRDHGVGTDVVVGLALDRGVEMVVALFGGAEGRRGPISPLDPDYPPERPGHMLRDSARGAGADASRGCNQFAVVLQGPVRSLAASTGRRPRAAMPAISMSSFTARALNPM